MNLRKMFKMTILSPNMHSAMPVATYLNHHFLVSGSSGGNPQYWKPSSPDLNSCGTHCILYVPAKHGNMRCTVPSHFGCFNLWKGQFRWTPAN